MSAYTPYRDRWHEVMSAALSAIEMPAELAAAMRYVLFNGGKRFRPLLVYLLGQDLGVSLDMLDAPAVAIECMHAYSLVHDDLPAMDNDDMRRGQPSCHRQFNEATAILVGDALQGLSFSLLPTVEMVRALADAAGPAGMVGGQYLDLHTQSPGVDVLMQIHDLKTARLIACAVALAALAAEVPLPLQEALYAIGLQAGALFQLQDDIFDMPAGDANNLAVVLGSSEALRWQQDLQHKLTAAIAALPHPCPRFSALLTEMSTRQG